MKLSIPLWILVFIGSVWYLTRLPGGDVTSDLMDLLPHSRQDSTVRRAIDTVSREARQQVFFLLSAPNRQALVKDAGEIEADIDASGLFEKQQSGSVDTARLFRYRYVLLTPADRKALKAGKIVARARRELAGPAGAFRAAALQRDPVFLFQHYVESLLPASLDYSLGFPSVGRDGKLYGLVVRRVASAGLMQQSELWSFLDALKQRHRPKIDVTGYPVFSAYGATTAQREITIIGSVSMAAIILLVLLVFRRILPLLLVVFSIGSGVLVAAAVTFALFGRVHILTLVAGSSLIGVSIDYSFHYFCYRFGDDSGVSGVIRGLTLGMGSSVGAYLLLALAPFPALQQIAVFSATGLFTTWLMAVTLYPAVYKPGRYRADALARHINNLSWKLAQVIGRHRILLISAMLAFSAVGIWRVNPEDDVRLLQSPPKVLIAGDARIRSVFPDLPDNRFLLVEGANSTRVSQITRQVLRRLDTLRRAGGISRYQSVLQAWPTTAEQRDNYRILEQNLYDNGSLASYLSGLGLPKVAIDAEYASFRAQRGVRVSIADWVKMVPAPWNLLWPGCGRHACGGVILLYGIRDPAAIAGIAKAVEGVKFVDEVKTTSAIMHDTRIRASWLLGLAVLLLLALLAPVLGVMAALRVLAVPAGAILFSLALTGYFGVPVSLFNIFALLLVLGIGVDYSIFNRLAGPDDKYVELAVLLSASTTILAFGLLSLSSTMAISAFGFTLLFGVAFALVTSTLARSGSWRHS